MITTGVNSSANSRNGGIGFREDNVDNKTVAVPVEIPTAKEYNEQQRAAVSGEWINGWDACRKYVLDSLPAQKDTPYLWFHEKTRTIHQTDVQFEFLKDCIPLYRRSAAPASPAQEPIGEVREGGVVWFGQNPHAHSVGTKFYTSPATSLAQQDERSAFEQWAIQRALYLTTRPDGEYASSTTQEAWDAWQARAAITAPQDAQERKIAAAAKLCDDMTAIAAGEITIPAREYAMHALADYTALTTAQPADKPEAVTATKDEQAEPQIGNFGDSSREQLARRVASLPLPNYAHPPAQPQLSDERIREIGGRAFGIDIAFDGHLMAFARRIESELLSRQSGENKPPLLCKSCGADFIERMAAQPQLSDEEIINLWDAQRQYHGGEPCKVGHLEFARAVIARRAQADKSADGRREG